MSTSQKIGLISDTHSYLPQAVGSIFKAVDVIIHAGDVGSQNVLKSLEKIAPVTAVRGNCDTGLVGAFLEDVEFLSIMGHEIAVMHKLSQVQQALRNPFKGVVVFGHTHNPEIFKNPGILYVNPGSPSQPRGLDHGTVAILTLKTATSPEVSFHKVAFD